MTMHYAILTKVGKGGSPFVSENPQLAPGSPLRVSEDATLIAFENYNDRLLARGDALAYGKNFWHVTEDILHADDLPAAETFSSGREFVLWLFESNKEA